jgi:ankyrin repeat protein
MIESNDVRLPSFISMGPTRTIIRGYRPVSKQTAHSACERTTRTGLHARASKRQVEPIDQVKTENLLVRLCRSHNWQGVLKRCCSHPQEASPQILGEDDSNRFNLHSTKRVTNQNFHLHDSQTPLYHETVLGIACAAPAINTEEMEAVIFAIVNACPEQVYSSQLIPGHTPLRDAIRNITCTTNILNILIYADLHLLKSKGSSTNAVYQKDRDGMYPIDHLIMGVQLGEPEQSLDLLKEFVKAPKIHNGSCVCGSYDVSPLIRLLSLGTTFGVKKSDIDSSPWALATEGRSRLSRVQSCAKYLLEEDPELIHKCSRATGCSPLHVALRNYGNYSPLISELVEKDQKNAMIKLRNHYGDLPLHTACSVGVPIDVLRLILERTIAATCSPNRSPDPLVWSVNKSGYTPIDLEWVRHIESGMGFYSARAFYPLEATGVRKHCRKQDEYYQDLLREAVDQVVQRPNDEDEQETLFREEETKNTFGILIDRLGLLIQAASFGHIPSKASLFLLHAASALALLPGPSLPLPMLELTVWLHRDQLLEHDEYARLPIHYALSRRKMSNPTSTHNSGIEWQTFVKKLLQEAPQSVKVADKKSGQLPLHFALEPGYDGISSFDDQFQSARAEIIEILVESFPDSIDIPDPVSGLFPFMLAAVNPSLPLDSVYFLLRRSPSRSGNSDENVAT